MSQMSLVKAERALENRAHVRMLLRLRQPAFAAALASAEQDVFTDRRGVAHQTCACSAVAGFQSPDGAGTVLRIYDYILGGKDNFAADRRAHRQPGHDAGARTSSGQKHHGPFG